MNKINVLSLFDGASTLQLALKNVEIPVNNYYASEIKPYAIKLSKHHFPDTIHFGDIRNWKNWDIDWKSIDLVGSGSPCFVKGTKILTKTGYVNIEDIQVGDLVLTHKKKLEKVLRVGYKYNKTIKIKAQGIKETETTHNHPYYVSEMKRVWDNKKKIYKRTFSDFKWVNAGNLTKNHFITLPILTNSVNKYNLTDEELIIIGRYLADGHTRQDVRKKRNTRYYQLILSIGENKVDEFTNQINDIHYSKYKHSKNVERIVFSNKRLVEIVEKEIGKGAKNKSISYNLLSLQKNKLKILIDSYMQGDGCFTNNKYKASSISEELIMSLNIAIAKVYNVNSSFDYFKRPKTTIIEGRTVNQNDTYSTHFNKEFKKQSKATIKYGYILLPIKSIKETNNIKQVYNLEIENDNTYTANNAIVHNCQDLSIAGKRKGITGERSSLFFVFVEILNHIRKYNPDVKFLQENVASAPVKDVKIMSDALGIYPQMIDSKLFVPQSRKRLYWSNIKTCEKGLFNELYTCFEVPTKRKQIYAADIIENGRVAKPIFPTITERYTQANNFKDKIKLKKRLTTKGVPYVIQLNKSKESNGSQPYSQNIVYDANGILPTICKRNYGKIKINEEVRTLTKIEMCRLQGFPDNYCYIVSYNQAGSLLGDAWTLPVIEMILKQYIDVLNKKYLK